MKTTAMKVGPVVNSTGLRWLVEKNITPEGDYGHGPYSVIREVTPVVSMAGADWPLLAERINSPAAKVLRRRIEDGLRKGSVEDLHLIAHILGVR